MRILQKPTKTNAGIGIENNMVHHYIAGYKSWIPCGDCKITDEHIQKLLKRKAYVSGY